MFGKNGKEMEEGEDTGRVGGEKKEVFRGMRKGNRGDRREQGEGESGMRWWKGKIKRSRDRKNKEKQRQERWEKIR